MSHNSKAIVEQSEDFAKKELTKALTNGVASSALSLFPIGGELLKAIPDIYHVCKHAHFNDFLKGINDSLDNMKLSQKQLEQLMSKTSNLSTYTYLSSIIDSVLFSKSKMARTILGVITANYFSSDTIPYEDIIIINALKDLLDEELDAFVKIYEVAIGSGKEDENGEGAFYISYYADSTLINTAFCKLVSLNIIGSKANWLTSKSPASWHGNITSITKKFKHYIDISSIATK